MKRIISIFLVAITIVLCLGTTAEAKTQTIIVVSMTDKKLIYHKAGYVSDIIPDAGWENVIGYGKQKTAKISKNAKFYVLVNNDPNNIVEVDMAEFKEKLYEYRIESENGITWYWGTACKMTVKNGKVKKLVQAYQA